MLQHASLSKWPAFPHRNAALLDLRWTIKSTNLMYPEQYSHPSFSQLLCSAAFCVAQSLRGVNISQRSSPEAAERCSRAPPRREPGTKAKLCTNTYALGQQACRLQLTHRQTDSDPVIRTIDH